MNLLCAVFFWLFFILNFGLSVGDHDVAILMAGEVRTFALIEVRKHFIKAVVEPNHSPDIFLHLSHETTTPGWKLQKWSSLSHSYGCNSKLCSNSTKELESMIKQELNPLFMTFSTNPAHATENSFHQTYARWLELLNSMKKQEEFQNRSYEYIIRTRPDLGYLGTIDAQKFHSMILPSPNVEFGIFFVDFFAVLTRNAAEVALQPEHSCENYPICFVRKEMTVPAIMHKYNFGVYGFWIDHNDHKRSEIAGIIRYGQCNGTICISKNEEHLGCSWSNDIWFQTPLATGLQNSNIEMFPRIPITLGKFLWNHQPQNIHHVLNNPNLWHYPEDLWFFKELGLTEKQINELKADILKNETHDLI